jgi:hypothetical protein
MTFELIFTYITDLCPQLATKNTYAINEWLKSGYNTEKDIIPAIDRATKRGTRSIYSFNFFTPQIRAGHEARIKEQSKPIEIPSAERDRIKAINIAFVIRKCGKNLPNEEAWLKRYEEVNGRIA